MKLIAQDTAIRDTRHQIIVTSPIDEAFRYTADLNHLEDRHPDVLASNQTSPGPIGVGATFDVEFSLGGRRIPMVYTITDYQPPSRLALLGEGRVQRAVDQFTFAETPESTAITVAVDLRFKGPMKLVAPLLDRMMEKSGRRAVEGLAQALERTG